MNFLLILSQHAYELANLSYNFTTAMMVIEITFDSKQTKLSSEEQIEECC